MAIKFYSIFTAALCLVVIQVDSLCNVCQKNYVACVDEKRYALCNGGKPNTQINTCPDGQICTAKTSVCVTQSALKPVTPSCEMTCGQCNSPGNLFACLSNTTYAFCFGANVPILSATGVCPEGYICSLTSGEICKKAIESSPSCNALVDKKPITPLTTTESPKTTQKPKNPDQYEKTTLKVVEVISTSEATSSTTSTTTAANIVASPPTTSSLQISSTTTETSEFESRFCKEKQARGPHRAENDLTCQKFTLCYFLAGQYLELQYTCPGSEYFNQKTTGCQIAKPTECQTM